MTALELAEYYEDMRKKLDLPTNKALAAHLGTPYRTLKAVMKLNLLCPEAKRTLRQATRDPKLRNRLTAWALSRIRVEAPPQRQMSCIREILQE